MICSYCKEIESGKAVLHSDQDLVLLAAREPCVQGELLVLPRQHFTILEQVPDAVLGKLWVAAQRLIGHAVERLGAEGANFLIQNGIAAGQTQNHFSIRIIPRRTDDGLQLQWRPRQFSEDEFAAIELALKSAILEQAETRQRPVEARPQRPEPAEEWLIRQLERIP